MVDKIILELPADTVGGDILVSAETRERAEAAAAQAEATAAGMVVSGTVTGDNLVLTKADSTTVVAGDVRGPKGNDGSNVLPTDEAIAQAISTPGSAAEIQLGVSIAASVYHVGSPTGTIAGDTAAVVAACLAAKNADRKTVNLGPGHYQLDGLTVALIHDRYLVGDDVTFTPNSYVYPFRTSEFAQMSAERGRTGGRGRIAIEVDDAPLSHWHYLFPVSKELGITMGTAWHTDNGSQWIAEAHRHGWEIIHHLPADITATTYLANGTLEAAVESGLEKIEEQIGTRKNLGFVYPQHVRSLETDRILSKYFTRGRGKAGADILSKGVGHPWLTSAYFLDDKFTGGNVARDLVDLLEMVAHLDGQVVFYMHLDSFNYTTRIPALRKFVGECRRLGIDIVNPGQIWASTNIVVDPYLEDTTQWTLSGTASWDSARAYHGAGGRSAKFTAGTVGAVRAPNPVRVSSRPGMFGVYRASVRYSADSAGAITGPGNGLFVGPTVALRNMDGSAGSAPVALSSAPFPATGTVVPASNWERIQSLVYLGPATTMIYPGYHVQNLAAGTTIWLDEIKMEHIDWVASVTYEVTLNGTSDVALQVGIPDVGRYDIQVIPSGATAGQVTVTTNAGVTNVIKVKSTNAADTMKAKVIITPGASYASGPLSSEGA